MQTLAELRSNHAQSGRLEWIGVRLERKGRVDSLEEAELAEGRGLLKDRRANKTGGKRQVTLLQFEHLTVIASVIGVNEVDPKAVRRNLVVSGISLLALKDKHFSIGEVQFRGTGLCHPCSRMEEALGLGGYNAMRGHGGINAEVLSSGNISLGDEVCYLDAEI